MAIGQLKADVGAEKPQKAAVSSLTSTPKIMDLRPSSGLAAGLKRVGGRGGITRLGRTNRENLGKAKRGRPIILHKF